MRSSLRRAAAVSVVVVAGLLPAGVGAAVAAPATFAALHAPGPARSVPPPDPPVHEPTRPTAVVVLGERGAVASDVLGPYEALSATGRFTTYVAAPDHDPVTLTGGLDLVPHLSFAEVTGRLGGAAPDLVIVPALPDGGAPTSAEVGDWVRTQAAAGARVLGVCNGAAVLAAAGLLDGHRATAHWTRVERLADEYDRVDWVSGMRFVDDGRIVTTAGILSGIDGTLHLVEERVGAEVADRAAAALGWTRHRADDPVHAPGGPDPVAIVNAGLRWDPDRLGVALVPGVGELELASVFDVHGGQSLAARTVALSADGAPVRSRHGLTFLPRGTVADAAALDRLLVPGTRRIDAPAAEYLHTAGVFPFDAALVDLARTTDRATAVWTGRAHELPADTLRLDGPAWPWGPTLVPLALGAVAAALTALLLRRGRTAETPPRAPDAGRGREYRPGDGERP